MDGTTESSTGAPSDSRFQGILEQLSLEFTDQASDKIHRLNQLLESVRSGAVAADSIFDELFRDAHNLKGMAGSFGHPLLAAIAHRLEDYLSDLHSMGENHVTDVQQFVDRMDEALDNTSGTHPDAATIVRCLPAKSGFDVDDVIKENVEIMLVMPNDAGAKFIERELRACGYRVTKIASAVMAIEQAVLVQPDLVCVSAILGNIDGVDIACALKAMPCSRDIPICLVTSLARNHDDLTALPDGVPVVGKGAQFSDDIAHALSQLGVT